VYESDGTSTTIFGRGKSDMNKLFTHINEETGTTIRFCATKISGKGAWVSDILLLTTVSKLVFNDFSKNIKYEAEFGVRSGAEDDQVRILSSFDQYSFFRLTSRILQVASSLLQATSRLNQVTDRAPRALQIEHVGEKDPRRTDEDPDLPM
jgi:hypothetical protein